MKFNKVSRDYKQLNDYLRGELRRKKISQEALAYSLNISRVSVSSKLSGKKDWTVWELLNIFELLEISFNYGKESKNEQ